jgi:type IV fimbrial biogenesis protein FimT
MSKPAGITLVELLTTISVIAVLAALVAPGFSALSLDSRRTAAVNEFFHALFLARAEAVRRAQIVSLCQSTDRQQCDNDAPRWARGWIVFVNQDPEEPPRRSPDEEVILASEGWSGGQITSSRGSYSFRPATQGVVNGTIVFCDTRGSAHARAIIVSHAGRPRVAQRDANNKPLRCPPG